MNGMVLASSINTPNFGTSTWIALLIGIIIGFIIARKVG